MKTLKSLYPFVRRYIPFLILGFIFIFIQNFGMVEIPISIKAILDEIVNKNRERIIVGHIIRVLVITNIVAAALFLMRKIIIGVSRRIEYDIRKKLFNKLLSLDYYFFLKNRSGDLSSRITNDLNEVRVLLGPGIMYVPNSISRIIIFMPVLVGLSGLLMILTSIMMIGLILIILFLMPKIRPYFARIQERTGSINNRVWQILTGISTIKQNTMERREIQRFYDLGTEYLKDQMAMVRLRGFLRPLFIFIFSLIELVILLVGGRMVINGEMSIGELLQFNIMISALIFPVLSFGWIMAMIQQGIAAMERINYILDEPEPNLSNKQQMPTAAYQLEIRNLSFTYPGESVPTLKEVSFSVNPGETIGITGLVGSGKTTLVDILTGILKPDAGMVFINGIDITDIDPESLYQNISVVSQEPFLFSKSISDNIALGLEQKEMKSIIKAAEMASLDGEIDGFKERYDQTIGERGITLSGGQKQRASIARALIKPTQVLFLDDPLSSVDSRTEETIIDNLNRLKSAQDAESVFNTMFIISHRISTLKLSDKILVFKNGRIIEQGDHDSLVQKQGLYFKLSEMQKMEAI